MPMSNLQIDTSENTGLVSRCGERSNRLVARWNSLTRLEQCLLILTVSTFIVIFALSITVAVNKKVENVHVQTDKDVTSTTFSPLTSTASTGNATDENFCLTKQCVLAAGELLKSMDQSVNPCDDFYGYACQGWINDATITEQLTDRFSSFTDKMNLKLKDLLEEDANNSTFPEHFLKARAFYQSCKNFSNREDEGLSSFLKDIEYFGGYPALQGESWNAAEFDYVQMMKKMLEKGFDYGILLSITLAQDPKNTSREFISLQQTTPGMSEPDYFKYKSLLLLYKDYASMYAAYLCEAMACNASAESILDEMEDAVELEINITKMFYPKDYVMDHEKTYHVMTVSNLSSIASEINWLEFLSVYFPNLTITDNTEILVTVPDFISNFSKLLYSQMSSTSGRRRLANYMVYRQVKESTLHLNRDMNRAFYDFQGAMSDVYSIPELWHQCVGFTTALFDLSLASQYVKKFVPTKRRDAVYDLVDRLKKEISMILNRTVWMDQITKQEALKKLDKIYLVSIYPDGLLNDTLLDLWYQNFSVEISHYENFKKGNIFLTDKQLNGFGDLVDPSNWKYLSSSLFDANAYYHPQNNSIFVPIPMAQDWFFEEDAHPSVNYGRLGFVLGHEMSHAFDTKGAKLDEHGNQRNWWQNETLSMFRNKSKCMSDMFDSYYVEEANTTINGTRTITENIADDIGISEAYSVFLKALKEKPSLPLPGLSLTVKQLFWVNYAMIWCEKDVKVVYEDLIKNDEHSPSRFRVISPLSNNNYFLGDFNCKPGDKMYRQEAHCHVWDVETNNQ